jgi:ubiquinone/menaquinone biosynthesis C-methylase UbiE
MELDPVKRAIAETWDRGATTYDDLVGHGQLSADQALAWKAVLAEVLPKPPGEILEVGAGTAAIGLLMAELGYRVTAVDLSRGMLERARMKAVARNLTMTFDVGDAEALPYPDTRFDAVVTRHLVWSLPNPDQAMREWRRLVKPGGAVIVIDSMRMPGSLLARIRERAGLFLLRLRPSSDAGHRYPDDVRASLPLTGLRSPDRYRALLEAAGLPLVVIAELETLHRLELRSMPLRERWASSERIYLFAARRPYHEAQT